MQGDPLFQILERAIRSANLAGDAGFVPAVDVYEVEDGADVVVELAGLGREDVSVTVDGDVLVISGARREFMPADSLRIHNLEIDRGRFVRRIRIPNGFDLERTSARMENGLLFVRVPRRAARTVPVDVRG